MSAKGNKTIVQRFFEGVFNNKNLSLIDEFIAPGYTNHSSSLKVLGPEGARQTISAELQAFPDLHTTIEDIIAEGDKVVVRCIDHFTRRSDGAMITLPWIEILRLEKGKAVESWFEADLTPILADFKAALGRK